MGFFGFGGERGGPKLPMSGAENNVDQQHAQVMDDKEITATVHNEAHGESWEAVQNKIVKHLAVHKELWQDRTSDDKGKISENTTSVIENIWGKQIDIFDTDDIRHFRDIMAEVSKSSDAWALADVIGKVDAREKELGAGQMAA